MSIYRGTGGASSTTDEATVTEVTTLTAQAASSASSAASSASSAASSATTATNAANTSTTNATTASNAATSASASASSASTSASNASASETAAALSEANAETSELNALASAVSASSSASNASSSATAASSSASAAQSAYASTLLINNAAATSATAAQTAETAAEAAQTAAELSASNAASSASSASTSASTASAASATAQTAQSSATASANAASLSATAAATSESNSADSAAAALISETNAATSETNAASSATSAATSASNASASASTATTQAAAASTYASQAAGSATTAANEADSASAFADSAYASAQSALSAVAYQDLAAIAESKAVTAVDVFVYDTSKDSDGGAWRKRTQHTSWYDETLNTATRGARKEFPAVAVIVAESNKVTIYDGDDPSLPMWMVFNVGSTLFLRGVAAKTISMLNGTLAFGSNASGFSAVSFIEDDAYLKTSAHYRWNTTGIENRNLSNSFYIVSGIAGLVNSSINDVAMTVLPSAPIDSATGLPVPTIAVATDGGVSVIKDDGTVVDITHSSGGAFTSLSIDSNNRMWFEKNGAYDGIRYADIPTSDTVWTAAENRYRTDAPALIDYSAIKTAALDTKYIGGNLGLSVLEEDAATKANGMVNYITSSYNTGWMHGDVKGAFLSDTTAETVVGSELVTNGTFDVDSGWTKEDGWSIGSGVLAYSSLGTGREAYQTISTVTAGTAYIVTFDVVSISAGSVGIYSSETDVSSAVYFSTTGTKSVQMTTTGSSMTLRLRTSAAGSGDISIDNISVRLAEADRSVNNNGLIVHGSITKTPVATGADLVGYSGWSDINYVEQPYNSDLDFGTGDFHVMGWVKDTKTASECYINKGITGRKLSVISTPTEIRLYIAGSVTTSIADAIANTWKFIVACRLSGVAQLYIDGRLKSSAANSASTDETDAVVVVGNEAPAFGLPAGNSSLALWRIGAGAPTAEQIKKIYEDEKVLFQEGAQATLYGSSDAVTALAYDEVTDLLHVGTGAGRSVFSGLRRVDNTTDAVGAAISASNGLVVEE